MFIRTNLKIGASAVLLCALLHSMASSLTSAEHVNRSCTARWTLLTTQRNHLSREFTYEFSYRVGLQSSSSSWRQSWEKDPETLVAIAARVTTGSLPQSADVRLANSELSSSGAITKTGRVTVPAHGAVTVWQLVAESQGSVIGFENTAVTTSDLEELIQIGACSATYKVRALVGDSWVLLKNEMHGKYMTITDRKGWDAATLGYSRSYRFRLERYSGSVFRIIAESHRFSGYYYAYSSVGGGIYFSYYEPGYAKQMWTLSNPNPRDGDSVTFRNEYWPGAYITYYYGSTTNVFCEETHSPDRWIIELA